MILLIFISFLVVSVLAESATCVCTAKNATTVFEFALNGTQDCFACHINGTAAQIGCSNFSTTVADAVSCSQPLVDWSDALHAAEPSSCDPSACCCPAGDWSVTQVNASSLHLSVGLAGRCAHNATLFNATVLLERLNQTFFTVAAADQGWPFAERTVVRTNDDQHSLGGGACGFVLVQDYSRITYIGIAFGAAFVLGVAVFCIVSRWRKRRAAFEKR